MRRKMADLLFFASGPPPLSVKWEARGACVYAFLFFRVPTFLKSITQQNLRARASAEILTRVHRILPGCRDLFRTLTDFDDPPNISENYATRRYQLLR